MRILALPAALLLGAVLYTNFPQAHERLNDALRRLFFRIRQLFTSKKGKTDERSACIVFFLVLSSAAILLSAIHPVAAALVSAPLFSGFSPLSAAAEIKRKLDSGRFSKNIPEYERQVLIACAPLGESFALRVCAPLLLSALGMILHVGGALGWLYTGLYALQDELPAAKRFLYPIQRAADALFVTLLLLCAGLVGRNPLRVSGRGAGEKLMHILGLHGEIDHAPIAGDITQAIFLCCMITGLLCLAATLIGIVF